jgi:hypothetical protein
LNGLQDFQTDPVTRSLKASTLGVNSHKATQAWNSGMELRLVASEMTTELLKESRRSAARAGTW